MKYECKSCGLECSVEANFEPTVCLKTGIICYGWHKVTAPAPKPLSDAILPKLTVEVFDREDCPEWANYAAGNANGKAWVYSDEPTLTSVGWAVEWGKAIPVGSFTPSDWQHSLIKRPEKKKLPDWVKVGAWVFDPDYMRYAQIIKIQGNELVFKHGNTRIAAAFDSLKPAHIRPWTFEEAPYHFKTKDDVFVIVGLARGKWGYWAKKEDREYTLAKVAKLVQVDGSPCGVLEVAEVGK